MEPVLSQGDKREVAESLDGRTTETCLLLDQRYENHNRQLPILGEVERVQLQALGRTQQQSSPQAPSNHPRRPQLQTEDSAFSLTSRAAPPSVVSKSAFSEFFVGSNYTAGSEAHSVVLDLPDRSGKRYLSHQHSLLAFKPSIWSANSLANNMHGVDENIYHWKVLNLSRAKLKASSRTSALLSGFAMVAMVEIQIDKEVPVPLLVTFVICTVLLIAVHMLALMISTCILPNVEAVANLHFQTNKTVFESPHSKMNFIVELAWGFSTVLGILLFLVEIAILCWVKFYTLSFSTAWVATGLLIPIVIIFIAFAALFYLKLVAHKAEVHQHGIEELENLNQQLKDAAESNGQGLVKDTNNGGGDSPRSRSTPTPSGIHII